jgi:hypothetical protein
MLVLTNTIVFFALFGIWSKSDLFNFGIKMLFLLLAIANLVAAVRG